jgi:hypothetical protein
MDKEDPTLFSFLAEKEVSLPEVSDARTYRYTLTGKVSLEQQQRAVNYAANLTKGNMSAFVRKVLGEWEQHVYPALHGNDAPENSELAYLRARAAYRMRRQHIQELVNDALDLMLRPDESFEAVAASRAGRLGIDWPPADDGVLNAIVRCRGMGTLAEYCEHYGLDTDYVTEHTLDLSFNSLSEKWSGG